MIKLKNKLKAFWRDAFADGILVGVTYLIFLAIGLGFLFWGCWALGIFVGGLLNLL